MRLAAPGPSILSNLMISASITASVVISSVLLETVSEAVRPIDTAPRLQADRGANR